MTQSNGRIAVRFVTVLWGDWRRGMFLTPICRQCSRRGNLPALAGRHRMRIPRIHRERRGEIRTPTRLQAVAIAVAGIAQAVHAVENQESNHAASRNLAEGDRACRRRGAFILLMPPDVAWADGSFARLRAALEAGKRAIFMAYPRVVSETIVPAMAERFARSADLSVTIPASDMMALAVTHIHPLMAAYSRSASHFPVHPEMILWPIEGDGFLLRLLARELFCFEPGPISA